MKKNILFLALFATTLVTAQGGYSPYSRLRLTSDPVLYSTSDQILVRDVTTGNVGKVSKASLFTGTDFIGGTGTVNFLPKFTGSKTLGNSQFFDNGGLNIGVSNANYSEFRIMGSFSGDMGGGALKFTNLSKTFAEITGETESASNGVIVIRNLTSNVITEKARILSNGNLGLGTSSPTEKLDVNGNIQSNGKLKIADTNGITIIEDRNGSIVFRVGTTGNATLPTTDNTGFESDVTQKAIVTKENLYREFRSINSESSNRTLTANDGTVYLITANPRTFTLPPASLANQGKRYVVKNLSSGVTLTVNVTNGGLIDGVTSKQFNTQYSGCVVQSTGDPATGYIIIGTF